MLACRKRDTFMLKSLISAGAILLIAGCAAQENANRAPVASNCPAGFAGTWQGRQTDAGGGGRDITITMRADCTYTWVTTRTTTEGAITVRDGAMTYRNAAGSFGEVTGDASELNFRHARRIYTVSISKR